MPAQGWFPSGAHFCNLSPWKADFILIRLGCQRIHRLEATELSTQDAPVSNARLLCRYYELKLSLIELSEQLLGRTDRGLDGTVGGRTCRRRVLNGGRASEARTFGACFVGFG